MVLLDIADWAVVVKAARVGVEYFRINVKESAEANEETLERVDTILSVFEMEASLAAEKSAMAVDLASALGMAIISNLEPPADNSAEEPTEH